MKKRTLNKKLSLNSETLRNLDGNNLGNVAGEFALTPYCPVETEECTYVCSAGQNLC